MTKHFVIALCVVLGLSCKDEATPPPTYTPTVQLTVEDTGVTDVWLRLKFTDGAAPRTFAVRRDNATILSGTLATQDTLLVDTAAAPRHTYAYRAFRLNGAVPTDSSGPVQATTMDTSSHAFRFEIDTLGVGNASTLYDVAIINDTLAYAVGEMYLRDSTGQLDPTAYSVAIWNGSIWSLKRLYYGGNNLIASIRGVFAFGTNDIWLAAGSIFHWDGVSSQTTLVFSRLTLPDRNATVEKLWGTTNSDLFGVGNAGTIVHYANGTWQRVESGTTLSINDIWGGTNASTGEQEVLCVASNTSLNQGMRLLLIRNSSVTEVSTIGLPWLVGGIWFVPGRIYVVTGDGLFLKRSLHEAQSWVDRSPELTQFVTTKVSGTALNNVIVVGDFGTMLHFNGVSWYNTHLLTLPNGVLTAVDAKGKFVVGVGINEDKAIILRARQQ